MPILRASSRLQTNPATTEGAFFWNTPWSVVTQWCGPDQPDRVVARTYRDGSQAVVEIELVGVDPDSIELEAGPNRLQLRYSAHEYTLPLPLMIDQASVTADWNQGLLRVVADASASDRPRTAKTIRARQSR